MMEIYVLGYDYNTTGVAIEDYKSLIWTERFDTYGDFELHVPYRQTAAGRLVEGDILAIMESRRMMVVEKIKTTFDADGGAMLVYSGRDLTSLLDLRVFFDDSSRSWSRKLWGALAQLRTSDFPTAVYDFNNVQPTSSIPPTFSRIPPSGWAQGSQTLKDANGVQPFGIDILRGRMDGMVYMSVYRGNNKSLPDDHRADTLSLANYNPDFYESVASTVVWRNLACDPGFTTMGEKLSLRGRDLGVGGFAKLEIVSDDLSSSGKALRVSPPPPGAGNNATSAYLTEMGKSLDFDWHGRKWWGREVYIEVMVNVLKAQAGPFTDTPGRRGICVNFSTELDGLGTPWYWASAPNWVGRHKVSLTFTLPEKSDPQGFKAFTIRLLNGSGGEDESVEFSNLLVMDGNRNPIGGYFDGDVCPDQDLRPRWSTDDRRKAFGELCGDVPAGIQNVIGGSIVQSSKWAHTGTVSARLITGTENATTATLFTVALRGETRYLRMRRYLEGPIGAFGPIGQVILRDANGIERWRSPSKSNVMGPDTIEVRLPTGTPVTSMDVVSWMSNSGESIFFDELLMSPDPNYFPMMNTAVILSEMNDDFLASNSVRSIESFYNVARVTRGKEYLDVTNDAPGTGTMRRVLHVDAENLKGEPHEIRRLMEAEGVRALGEHQSEEMIDGEILPSYGFEYGKDYLLGDIVSVQDRTGRTVKARVVEYIYVADENGVVEYPTFRAETLVVDGTWSSRQYYIDWSAAQGTWQSQP